jgi:amidophosphoribosyltransferase
MTNHRIDEPALGEKCGVFGIYGHNLNVANLAFYGLFALQHRGQISSGITVGDGKQLASYRGHGLVTAVYNEDNLKKLDGFLAIGHNRYATSGNSNLNHSQPIVIDEVMEFENDMREGSTGGLISLAHNGNLPSVLALEEFLSSKQISTTNCSDSELMAHAVSVFIREGYTLPVALKKAISLFTGVYSLVLATPDTLVAIRDCCGIRPLALGKINGGYVVASESCAFQTIKADFIRDIEPGEMIVINESGLYSEKVLPSNPKIDIFEFVYFARPDSVIEGQLVYNVRKNSGIELAKEFCPKADMVVPIPQTSIPVAIGYSHATGIPYEMAIVKNNYIHRTFIEPEQRIRDLGVKLKLNPLPEVITGKRVIIIDDSVVRGTTSREIIKAVFEAGAKEVHFLVSSPPVRFPDFYGIDTSKQERLIASSKTVEEIREFLGATSLHFLSLEGLIRATNIPAQNLSTSCFTGEYPIPLHERESEFTLNVPNN